jgi:hypothetical protein
MNYIHKLNNDKIEIIKGIKVRDTLQRVSLWTPNDYVEDHFKVESFHWISNFMSFNWLS